MMMMEGTHQKQEPQSSSPCVYEIPGEPAIVIDGVPNISPASNAFIPMDIAGESESKPSPSLGEWLVGREVRKMFGDQYYSGKVANFDQEMKWYRVEYEDGDFEDLEWCELKEVLLPLDVAISLKALALKIFKCEEKSVCVYGENTVGLRKTGTKILTNKRKMGEENHKDLLTESECSWQVKENADYQRTTQEKINQPKEIKALVTQSECSWQVKENADYQRTTQEKINQPKEIKALVTQSECSWQVKENADYQRIAQEKINWPKGNKDSETKSECSWLVTYNGTAQVKINRPEENKALVTKSECSWQVKENADYEKTAQGKINRPKEIRRTINAEKQKRRIRNAIEGSSAEGKTSNI
eukprot:TRINITY_DN3097_c0_g1_i4.p1 TRINITY_DN3097_c0_g1~~TRINITY_DN3097_c0_g1_i4.p1  ORF type:complete len:358 (+),score=75.64 TRINITY_DN3097_c0_g1_i4:156-1229(+)